MMQEITRVCISCGLDYGQGQVVLYATFVRGYCDVCKKTKLVTDSRTYGVINLKPKKKLPN